MSFEEHYAEMGLIKKGEGSFYYADRYGEVVYKQLTTKGNSGILDNHDLSLFALFTKGPSQSEEFIYGGNLSNSYNFIGNDVINESIRTAVEKQGSPIFTEEPVFSSSKSKMSNRIIIHNKTNIPESGDCFPMLTVFNSYDGSMSARIAFGLYLINANNIINFSFKMGELKQIHLQSSNATMQAAISSYIESFPNNITSLIEDNFNNLLTEDDVLGLLELVEQAGKRRKIEVSKMLKQLVGSRENGIASWGTSSFNLFLAITKYSSLEKNLNAKRLLESVAERVLVVPPQMMEILKSSK